MSKADVIGILIADIHLSLRPPIWRSAEPDWLEAQRRPLDEVNALSKHFGCPILCAGDVFNKWNSSPELINWAGDVMPQIYAIPGQHDLPLHRYEDIKKSAYYSLVKMNKIQNILPGVKVSKGGLRIQGFPYGVGIEKAKAPGMAVNIALVHEYIWTQGYSYPNADPHRTVSMWSSKLHKLKYNTIVFGDNHKGFTVNIGVDRLTTIHNCGALMRRNSDQVDYKPVAGLLREDGMVYSYELDTSEDKYIELPKATEPGEFDLRGFIRELEGLGDTAFDFADAVRGYIKTKKINPEVKAIILEALGR